jgi:hypothetical protein
MKILKNRKLNIYGFNETRLVYNSFVAKTLSHIYYYPVPVNLNLRLKYSIIKSKI